MKIGGFFIGLATGLFLTYLMLIFVVFDLEASGVGWEPSPAFYGFQWLSLIGAVVSVMVSVSTVAYGRWKKT